MNKFLLSVFSTVVLLGLNAFAIPSGTTPLPNDAQLEFVCGPFTLNGKVSQPIKETRIYFSHSLGTYTGSDILVYLATNGDTANTYTLDSNQALEKNLPDGSVTKYYAGSEPGLGSGSDYELANLALTFDKTGNPSAADFSLQKLTYQHGDSQWITVGTAICTRP